MSSPAMKTYLNKTVERLYGIIEGISIDCRITDHEFAELKNWIDMHEHFHEHEPFNGLITLLDDILADGIIEKDEREELLEWCSETINDRGFMECLTATTRRLHGICSGILLDGKITIDEIKGLQDWLLDYEHFQNWWPINEMFAITKHVLTDGKIDKQEEKQLKEFFSDFMEQAIENPEIHDEEYYANPNLLNPSKIFKSISSICTENPDIVFKSRHFCLTGPAASGKRKDLFRIISDLKGIPHNTVVSDLDYLIIGAQSSPAWVYSTYGRKIEQAVMRNTNNDKKRKCKAKNICIIREYDFINAAVDKGGKEILPDPCAPPF